MSGMDMGVATLIGSFTSFIVNWVLMMAAMMIVGLGILTIIAPSTVLGLMPPM